MKRDHFVALTLIAVIFYIIGTEWPNYGNLVVAKVKGWIPGL